MGTIMPGTICKVTKDTYGGYFVGEFETQSKQRHGRGIEISWIGNIYLGRWISGWKAPGNFINIESWGKTWVGDIYETANGDIEIYKQYYPDNLSRKIGY